MAEQSNKDPKNDLSEAISHEQLPEDNDATHKALKTQEIEIPQPLESNSQAIDTAASKPKEEARTEITQQEVMPLPPALPDPAAADTKIFDEWSEYDESKEDWELAEPQTQAAEHANTELAAVEADSEISESIEQDNDPSHRHTDPQAIALDIAAMLLPVRDAKLTLSEEILLQNKEILIGRAPHCDVLLSFHFIAKEHAKLVYSENGYSYIPLSKNHTSQINNKIVSEAKRLENGDLLTLGELDILYSTDAMVSLPSEVSPQEEAPSEEKHPTKTHASLWQPAKEKDTDSAYLLNKPFFIHAGVIFVMFQLIALAAGYWLRPELANLGLVASPEILWHQEEQAISLFKQHEFAQAESILGDIIQQIPNHGLSQLYLRSITKEKEAQNQLLLAKEALQNQQWQVAQTLATELSLTTFHDEAKAIAESIQKDIEQKLNQANQFLKTKKPLEAWQILNALEKTNNNRADILIYSTKARLQSAAQNPKFQENNAMLDIIDGNRSTNHNDVPIALRQAIAHGKLAEAIELLHRSSSPKEIAWLQKIKAAKNYHDLGEEEYQGKRFQGALEHLTLSLQHIEELIQPSDPFYADLAKKIADMSYLAGIQARQHQHDPQAFLYFKQATTFSEKHALSRKQLALLNKKAQSYYLQAQHQKNAKKARQLYLQGLDLISSTDPLYGRIKQKLDLLP